MAKSAKKPESKSDEQQLEKQLPINTRFRQIFGPRYLEHHPVAEYMSTKLGGVAEYIVIAETTDDLIQAARVASQYRVPFVVVGGGTGMLVSDVGYPGLIIINRTSRIIFDNTTSQVVVDSGVINNHLLNIAVSKGLGGIEFLATIPGSIGGAAATNATYGKHSIKSSIREMMVFVPDGKDGQVVTVTNREIEAAPYERLFSPSSLQQPVILTVRLQLARIDQPEILRRLLIFRQERQRLIEGQRLGSIFLQRLKDLPFKRSELLRLKAEGAGIEGKDLDIIVRFSNKAGAHSIKGLIDRIKNYAEQNGFILDTRVHFLGYYPSDGEDTETSS